MSPPPASWSMPCAMPACCRWRWLGSSDNEKLSVELLACRCWPSSALVRARRIRRAGAGARARAQAGRRTHAPRLGRGRRPARADPVGAGARASRLCRQPRPDRGSQVGAGAGSHRRRLDPHLRPVARTRIGGCAGQREGATFCRAFHAELVAVAGHQSTGRYPEGTARCRCRSGWTTKNSRSPHSTDGDAQQNSRETCFGRNHRGHLGQGRRRQDHLQRQPRHGLRGAAK